MTFNRLFCVAAPAVEGEDDTLRAVCKHRPAADRSSTRDSNGKPMLSSGLIVSSQLFASKKGQLLITGRSCPQVSTATNNCCNPCCDPPSETLSALVLDGGLFESMGNSPRCRASESGILAFPNGPVRRGPGRSQTFSADLHKLPAQRWSSCHSRPLPTSPFLAAMRPSPEDRSWASAATLAAAAQYAAAAQREAEAEEALNDVVKQKPSKAPLPVSFP